jgi:hypothetical protein
MKFRIWTAILMILASPCAMRAQVKYPPETRNAALRYWFAFAEIKDPPPDKDTQELLEKTLAGETAWDETKLGPILDLNANALAIFQRATRLPECDWGLEYSQGPSASIAQVPRARVLARLNTLQGIRQMANGQSQAAVETWLTGIRFSQQVVKGGTLVTLLVARSALMPILRVLTTEAKKGHLNEAQKKEIGAAVKVLPEDGFDWSTAWGLESAVVEQALQELRKASNPSAVYESMVRQPAPKQGMPPTAQEIEAYWEYMMAVQTALREPPAKAKTLIEELEDKRHKLSDVEKGLIPSAVKPNGVRLEVAAARKELLEAVSQALAAK